MVTLVDYILESFKSGIRQKTAKGVNPKLEEFIKDYCETNKKPVGKPKKLVVYPDGIGIHDQDFKDNYEEPYLKLKLNDRGDLVDIPDELYEEISKDFLDNVFVSIEVPSEILNNDRQLDKIYKNLPKIDSLKLSGLIKISSTGKERDLYSIDDIEKFLKKYKSKDIEIRANAQIEDLEGWDPKVSEFGNEFSKMAKKYNVGPEFVLSGKSYRQSDIPQEYRK